MDNEIVYEALPPGEIASDFDNAATIEDSQEFSEADIKHNMAALILLDSTYLIGMADLALVMQPLMVFLKASNTMIGFVTGATFMGLIGVFFSPWITRRFRIKKWYMFWVNVPYLGAIGLTGLVVLMHQALGIPKGQLLWVVAGLTLAQWFFAGFCTLVSQEYMTACIPVSHRGRLMGYSYSIGAAASVGAAALGWWILRNVPKPAAFGYVFLIAWLICQGGFIAAIFAREKPTPVEKSPKPWSKAMLHAAWVDKPFLQACLLFLLYTIILNPIFAFVNIYGLKELKMIAATSAIIQIVSQVVRVVWSAPIGHFVDKHSPKKVFPYMFILSAVSLLPPIFIHNAYGVYISVALSTMYIIGTATAWVPILYGLPSPENRAGHFTVQLIIQYGAFALGPILMGYVCDHVEYRMVFGIMALVSLGFFPLTKYLLTSIGDTPSDGSRPVGLH